MIATLLNNLRQRLGGSSGQKPVSYAPLPPAARSSGMSPAYYLPRSLARLWSMGQWLVAAYRAAAAPPHSLGGRIAAWGVREENRYARYAALAGALIGIAFSLHGYVFLATEDQKVEAAGALFGMPLIGAFTGYLVASVLFLYIRFVASYWRFVFPALGVVVVIAVARRLLSP